MGCRQDSRKLSEILPYILPYCPALPEEMGMDYGRRAYIEFVRRSGALHRELIYDLQDGVCDYPLDTPRGYRIDRINWVEIAGFRVVVPTFDHDTQHHWVRNDILNYAGGSMRGTYGYGPNYWYPCGRWRFHIENYSCLILHGPPDKDHPNALRVEVSILPEQEVCTFDDEIFERWVEGIKYGALSKALLLNNTDWFNPQLAALYDNKFRAEIQRARHKYDLNNCRGPMRMKARRFV